MWPYKNREKQKTITIETTSTPQSHVVFVFQFSINIFSAVIYFKEDLDLHIITQHDSTDLRGLKSFLSLANHPMEGVV